MFKSKYVKHLVCFVLVAVFIFSFAVPSSASSSKVYNIYDDFDLEFINGKTGYTVTNSGITCVKSTEYGGKFYRLYPASLSDQAKFYAGTGRCISAIKLENLSLKTEYNLKFSFYSTEEYSVNVTLFTEETNYPIFLGSADNGEIINCDVNFTLSELGFASNSDLKLQIGIIQATSNGGMQYYNFTDIVLTDLEDNTQFYDDVLIYLNRIYHSIAGGTDSSGVSHTGIVKSIQNLGSTLTSKLTSCTNDLKSKLDTCVTSLNNNLNSQLSTLWSNLNIKLNTLNSNLLAFKSSVEGLFNDFLSFFESKFTILFEKLDTLIKGKEVSKNEFDTSGKDEFDKVNSDIEDTESQLPGVDGSDIDNVVNTDILSELSKGFVALNNVFSIVVGNLGFTSVIVFFLSFGLAIYIIGRRLGGS